MNNTRTWLHGLGSAFIGGGATAITVMAIDPLKFNIHDGLKNVGTAFLIAGIINAAFYLKKSPLPDETNNQQTKDN